MKGVRNVGSNPTWRDFFRLTIIQRLIYLTYDIDIHIMDRRDEGE